MVRIKLKDYKGDFVCVVDQFDDHKYLNIDEIEEIKEYSQDGFIIYGTEIEKVFDEYFIRNYLKNTFESYADDNGYEDMNDCMNYDGEDWKKVEQAVREYFDSLGGANEIYCCNKNIIIEVE